MYIGINKNSKQRNEKMKEIYIHLHLNLPGRALNICNFIGQNDCFSQFFHDVYLQWPKLLGRLAYLKGFHCFYRIGPENIYFRTIELLKQVESAGPLKLMDQPIQLN